MRVIAKSTLKKFWEIPAYNDAQASIESWYEEAIKNQYANASICKNNRVVFNVGGNKYRLIVEIQYQASIVWVKFIGTQAQYDKINVEAVNEY